MKSGFIPKKSCVVLRNITSKIVSEIDVKQIGNFPFVSKLIIDSPYIDSPPTKLFRLFPNTKNLKISFESVHCKELGPFSPLTNLRELFIYISEQTIINNGFFNGLHKLNKLIVKVSSLNKYSGIFKPLINLKSLYLGGNNFTTLPNGFLDGLSSLQDLNLMHNPLSSIPDDIFTPVINLWTLNIRDIKINKPPSSILNLSKLNRLDHPKNMFKNITVLRGITQPQNLFYLYKKKNESLPYGDEVTVNMSWDQPIIRNHMTSDILESWSDWLSRLGKGSIYLQFDRQGVRINIKNLITTQIYLPSNVIPNYKCNGFFYLRLRGNKEQLIFNILTGTSVSISKNTNSKLRIEIISLGGEIESYSHEYYDDHLDIII